MECSKISKKGVHTLQYNCQVLFQPVAWFPPAIQCRVHFITVEYYETDCLYWSDSYVLYHGALDIYGMISRTPWATLTEMHKGSCRVFFLVVRPLREEGGGAAN